MPDSADTSPGASESSGGGRRCPECHGYVGREDRRCPHCGSRKLPAFAGDVEIRGGHVVVAAGLHVALIAATYALLGWSGWCAAALVGLFLLFPKLVEAVARAMG